MTARVTRIPCSRILALSVLGALALGGCGSTPTQGTSLVTAQAFVPSRTEGPASLSGDYAGYPAARQFVDRMATKHGFDRDEVARNLSRAQRQDWILDLVNRPSRSSSSGPTGAWTRYRAKFITDSNIGNGVDFWVRNAGTLHRAEVQYGVPPEAIVGILGVETRWGGYVGKTRVMDALTTLAFDYPRRSDFFTDELEAFLVMSRDEHMDPFAPEGSYAGAMGLGQFMPSSFQKYAVDFDGDGRRNLWDTEDAIGSVANYFAAHGWRRGEPVVIPAHSSGSAGAMLKTGYDTSYSPSSLRASGVSARGPIAMSDDVSLLRLDSVGGYEYWLGLHNFYVITRYNHSTYYAMAVYELGQAVKARVGGRMMADRGEDAGNGPVDGSWAVVPPRDSLPALAPSGPALSLR